MRNKTNKIGEKVNYIHLSLNNLTDVIPRKFFAPLYKFKTNLEVSVVENKEVDGWIGDLKYRRLC